MQVVEIRVKFCPSFTDDHMKPVRGLFELRVLELGGTQVTDTGLAHLRGLKTLEFLDMYWFSVTLSLDVRLAS